MVDKASIHLRGRSKKRKDPGDELGGVSSARKSKAEPTGIFYGESLSEYLLGEDLSEPRDCSIECDVRFLNYYRYLLWRKSESSKEHESRCDKSQVMDPRPNAGSEPLMHFKGLRRHRSTTRHLLTQWSFDSLDEQTPHENFSKSNLLLRTRMKQFIVRKSPIHSWGLYAVEDIPAGSFVTAYLGEKLRSPCLALLREREWNQFCGIESSYLFRVSPDLYIDATMMGASSRFLNHSCDPNLYANIDHEEKVKTAILPVWDVSRVASDLVHTSADLLLEASAHARSPLGDLSRDIRGELGWEKVSYAQEDKGILFFAKRAITIGEELTYDYKFPREKGDKLPCYCQSKNCHGTLN
jgi:SET domain